VSWAVAWRWYAEFYRPCVSTDPGLASSGVGVRVAACNRDGWAPEDVRGWGLGSPCMSLRGTEPRTVVEEALEGKNPRRAPTDGFSLARWWGRRWTDSRGEQSFEAGVPAVYRRAQCRWDGDGTCDSLRCVEATGLAIAGNLRPGSWVPGLPSGRRVWRRSWRDRRKRPWRSCRHCAGGSRRANPQGSNGPREWVRLPGKGKLWRGAPGTRAAWNKAAKRRGPRRTAGSKRPRASRETAETVERGKNPEDGTDEGLAILVPHGRPQGSPRWRRGTRRSCVRGSKNLTRGRPAGPGVGRFLLEGAGSVKGRNGRRRSSTRLWRGPNPTRVVRETHVSRQGPTRNTPRSLKRRGGSAGSQ